MIENESRHRTGHIHTHTRTSIPAKTNSDVIIDLFNIIGQALD